VRDAPRAKQTGSGNGVGFIALIPLMTRVNRASSQHCFQVAQTPARGLTVPPEKWMFLVEKRANV
jgi:hypothetical protein